MITITKTTTTNTMTTPLPRLPHPQGSLALLSLLDFYS